MKFPDKQPIIDFTHTMRSRYGETDRMGYVYYGNYLQYFEVARIEMIRACGLSYREMEDAGVMLPVIHAEIQYKAPILYDEVFEIKVMMFDLPDVRLQTFYEIRTNNGAELHVMGEVTLVFMNAQTRRPMRAPQNFVEGLKNYSH